MRLSRYFLPILRETPKEAEIASHRLMLRAGMMRQEAAGIYAWLPLGFRVLKKIEQIVREEQDRAGAIELLMPTLQLADLWRESGRYDAYGQEMLRIKDRHEREMLYGPTNEDMITEIFRACVRSYAELPLNSLSHPMEIPRRAAAAFRRHARARVPDEGRLFFRSSIEAAARHVLQQDVRRLSAHLCAHGPESDPDARRKPARSAATCRHEFIILAETGESEVFCHKDVLDLPIPGADVDFDDVATSQAIIDTWTTLYAATDGHARCGTRSSAMPRRTSACGARHRGRPDFLFRHQIFRADEGGGGRPGRRRAAGPHGLLRGRRRSRLVGAIIEASHDEAGINWPEAVAPFKVGDPQSQAGRCRHRCAPARSSTATLPPRASMCSTTTSTSARARNSPPPISSACRGRSWSVRRAWPKARSSSSAAPTASGELLTPADAAGSPTERGCTNLCAKGRSGPVTGRESARIM